jgi:cell division protein FtsW (lipid II flippase)
MKIQEHPKQNVMEWFRSRTTWVLLGFLAIGAFFLFTEHTAHLLGILPFAIFLLCPLMMLFMHHGHGGHNDNDQHGGHEELPPEGEKP